MTVPLCRILISHLACVCMLLFCRFILILCSSVLYSCLMNVPEWRDRVSQTPFLINIHTCKFSFHVVCCLVTVDLTADINVLSVCQVICTVSALRRQNRSLVCFKLNMTRCTLHDGTWSFLTLLCNTYFSLWLHQMIKKRQLIAIYIWYECFSYISLHGFRVDKSKTLLIAVHS